MHKARRHATVAKPAGVQKFFGTFTKIRVGNRSDNAIFGQIEPDDPSIIETFALPNAPDSDLPLRKKLFFHQDNHSSPCFFALIEHVI